MIAGKSLAWAAGLGLAASVAVATPAVASASDQVTAASQVSRTVVTPASAEHAYEWNTAVAGSPPSGLPCVSMTGSTACFEANGDKLWVKDTDADGHSATASWQNYIVVGSDWTFWREGSCVNKLGAGTWGICNKDFTESVSGSYLDLWACVYDSADGTWHGCSGYTEVYNYN